MNPIIHKIIASLPYILSFFIVILFFLTKIEKVYTHNSIYGVWIGETKSESHKYVFNKDGTCTLTIKDNNSHSDQLLEGNFEIDFSKKPVPISIRNITDIDYPLHTILEFVDKDSIRLAMMSPRWRLRPISFDFKTSINLKRISKVGS